MNKLRLDKLDINTILIGTLALIGVGLVPPDSPIFAVLFAQIFLQLGLFLAGISLQKLILSSYEQRG